LEKVDDSSDVITVVDEMIVNHEQLFEVSEKNRHSSLVIKRSGPPDTQFACIIFSASVLNKDTYVFQIA